MITDTNTPQWRIPNWFSKIDKSKMVLLKSLFDELIRFNNALNLVSGRSLLVADAIHFADSILGAEMIFNKGQVSGEIYDFGSGNGFPGLVFGIMYPDIQVKLVDVDTRKCEYLKAVSHKLGLTNIQVLNTQIDKLPEGSVQFAMSRGLANISKSVLMVRKIVKSGGKYFHFKSEEWPKEVAEMPTALCSYWVPEHLGNYRLPIGEVQFSIVCTVRTPKSD